MSGGWVIFFSNLPELALGGMWSGMMIYAGRRLERWVQARADAGKPVSFKRWAQYGGAALALVFVVGLIFHR